jgi:hypothetical protein
VSSFQYVRYRRAEPSIPIYAHVEPRRVWRNPVLPSPELSDMPLAAAEYEKHGREGGPADD